VCNAYWENPSREATVNHSCALTIQSDITEIARVSMALEELMKAHNFREEDIFDTQLAVEEALTNVIDHGYSTGGGIIGITCLASREFIEVTIEDSAPPFNPLSFPEPELSGDIEDRKIGGLGVFLIRHVMDEISYRHENGKNILNLVKRRSS
jgi:serine/threonine-protein kinase RsbW